LPDESYSENYSEMDPDDEEADDDAAKEVTSPNNEAKKREMKVEENSPA